MRIIAGQFLGKAGTVRQHGCGAGDVNALIRYQGRDHMHSFGQPRVQHTFNVGAGGLLDPDKRRQPDRAGRGHQDHKQADADRIHAVSPLSL